MLVVIAEKEEFKLVEELGYSKYPVLITGVGGANIARALENIPRETEILNIGYCGSKYYNVGEQVEISRVGTYHEKAKFDEELFELDFDIFDRYEKVTKCYTSTDFVTSTKREEDCVFDMELFFIRLMFPNTRAIKVVSDNLNKKQYKETTTKT